MNQKSIGVRIAPYVVGIVCFVLPFIQVSCSGEKVMQFTGIQLVTGSETKEPMTGETKKIPPTPLAIIALVALLAGACFCLPATRASSTLAAIAGGVATVAMLFLKMRTDADITKEAQGMPITVEYLMGFWLVCIAAIGGLILSIMRTKENPSG